MFRQLLTIVIVFFSFLSFGNPILQKGFPFIKNFDISEYTSELQSWMSVQASNGFIYIANSSTLLEFDGVDWKEYSLPNNSALRSVAVDETGRIFVGGTREFGYFYPDDYGRLKYYSLSEAIDKVDFESVWRVLNTSHGIYFIAGRKYIYKFEDNELSLITIPPVLHNFRVSVVQDTLYFYDVNAGFGTVLNDTMHLMKHSKLPIEYTPYFFIEGNGNEIITGIRQKGIYKLKFDYNYYKWDDLLKLKSNRLKALNNRDIESLIIPVNKDLNKEISNAELYFGAKSNGNYFFTTLRQGIFITDKNFNLLNNFKKGTGIENDAVYHISVDKNSGVWITGEMGVSYVRYQNPFVYFNQRNGLNGIIISVKNINGKVLIGTTQGIFMLDKSLKNVKNIHQIREITNKYVFVLDMEQLKCCEDEILIASLRDILVYNHKTDKLKPIYKLYGTYDIEPFPNADNLYMLGHTEGVDVLKIERLASGEYKVERLDLLDNFHQNIRKIVFDNHNQLWMSTAYNGLFMAKFDQDGNVEKVKRYGSNYGINHLDNNIPFLYQDTLILATNEGLLYYDYEDNMFKPYRNLFQREIFDSVEVADMKIDGGKIWLALDRGLMYYDLKKKRFERTLFNRIEQYGSESMEIDGNGVIWLSGLNNMIAIDTNYLNNQYYKTPVYFRSVMFGKDSLYKIEYKGTYESSMVEAYDIPFQNNSLTVRVACPAYQTLENLQFQYRLIGLNDSWSDWSKNNLIKFNYLPGGNYTLEVIARDANLKILGKAVLKLSIRKPFYYSIWAILFYIVVGLIIIYLFIRLNSKRLQNDKKRLQNAINEAIFTVQQQKEEIEQQAQYLKNTNKELEKLSIVAEYTDNAVAIMDGKGNYQWINKGFTRMYGYEYEELIRDDDRSKIGRNANLRMNDLINVWFGDKKPIVYESLNKCKDGHELWVQTTLTPIIDSKGNVIKLITIDTDISKLKKAEKQIEMQRDEISKQRDLAYIQRDEILQQKKEITDSIHYAQRIQTALFPSKGVLDLIFDSNFIFDLPRDIVSGDFFWTHRTDDLSMLAVADCTGHGVPGAFMSLIGLNYLNDIVKNQKIYLPDLVLNKLRDNIISGLRQTTEIGDNKDGMDLALISYDRKNKILKYAGANNTAFLKRGKELIVLEPDKMPISIFRDIKKPFTLQTIDVRDGDILYMFSDGYTDQFGGKKGKKFKTINFKKLLLQIESHDLKDHAEAIKKTFYSWKGELDQVDDVLVIGLELK